MADIVQTIAEEADRPGGERALAALAQTVLAESAPTRALREFLTRWCQRTPRPLVLMLDEVDALIGDTLIALLRQLRTGLSGAADGVSTGRDFVRSPRFAGLPDSRSLGSPSDYRGECV